MDVIDLSATEEKEPLHVAVACGGTGGHTYPGLAVAHALQERGHRVTLWMSGKDVESQTVEGWQGNVVTIPAEGFQFGLSWKSIRTLFCLLRAFFFALPMLKKDRPDVVLAMGSYSSFAPIAGAICLHIPFVLHEANVVPGRLVSMMSSRASAIAISFEASRYYIKHPWLTETGMPLRIDLQAEMDGQTESGDKPFSILITGGSRGAQHLNEVIPLALRQVKESGAHLHVVHIAGLNSLTPIQQHYDEGGVHAEVLSYAHDMEKRYQAADIVICRAGASTCAEVCAFGKPSLLIPYPYAVRDHQMLNARALEKAGAADVIAQNELTVEWLASYVMQVMEDQFRRDQQAQAARACANVHAAKNVATLIEQVYYAKK
jgi:UDP-N-acetylglucosamine--N-acetylmuramyl-(pentapeptide) pyrophosphoryl-undecaprenol N-acetylglucosamine transferase